MATEQFEKIESGEHKDHVRAADGTVYQLVPVKKPEPPAGAPASPAPATPAAAATPPPPNPDPLKVWDELRATTPLAAARYLDKHPGIYRSIDARRRGAGASK